METEYTEWLKNLKNGDSVAIRQGFRDDYTLYKIERLTKTMIVLERGSRFSAKTGYAVGAGGGYSYTRIEPVTKEVTDRIKYSNLKYKLYNVAEAIQWACRNDNSTLEELEAIRDVLYNDTLKAIVEKYKAKVSK